MRELEKQVYAIIMNFVARNISEFLQLDIDRKNLRLAIPGYIKNMFINGSDSHLFDVTNEMRNEFTIYGIETHDTWENAITLYQKDYLLYARHSELPVFKLSFDTRVESVFEMDFLDGKRFSEIKIDIAQYYDFKL